MIELDSTSGLPFISLPTPHSAYILSLLQPSDVTGVYSSIQHQSVLENLTRAPEPYTLDDARSYLSIKANQIKEAASIDWSTLSQEEMCRKWLQIAADSLAVRWRQNGKVVGQVGIRRNGWEWMEDVNARESLIQENNKKEPGDSNIQYSIGVENASRTAKGADTVAGYYLSPQLQAQGLMTCVVSTLIDLCHQHLSMQHLEGICRKDNPVSRRVLEKNGFIAEKEMTMLWKGVEREIYMMRWRK